MARARNIKPGIMENEELAELSHSHRLLFIYLWMLADREGRLEDRPKRIKAQAFPYDESLDVNSMLDDLADHGFIRRYYILGLDAIQVVNFLKHQAPHMREKDSVIPPPEDDTDKAVPEHDLGSAMASPRSSDSLILRSSDSLNEDSLIADSALQQKDDLAPKDAFVKFWSRYPKKKAKPAAEKAWKKINPDHSLFNQIMESLGKHCVSKEWLKDDGQFIPHPATWLNQGRWEDEVTLASNVHKFPAPSRHTGFDNRDYSQGLTEREDGSYGF
jgi:hypothetical protein